MSIFKYTGEKGRMNGVFGYDFSDHKEVEIPETNSEVIGKLKNNSHFKLVGEKDDPDVNCDFGVFRVQENGQNYSKPDKVFELREDAEIYISEQTDEKKRTVLKRTKA